MPAVVSPGEFVHYTARYCLYTDVVPTVRRYFIDGIEYKAQEDSFGLHKGCNTTQVSIHIPETLNAGNYHLRVESDYHMNPIQVIHKANISTMFEIKIPHQDEAQDLIDMQKVTKGE